MKQLDYDIEILNKKLENEFDQYEEPEQGEKIEELETAMKESVVLNTHIQYGRFLTSVYARRRCKAMMSMTRGDILNARTKHRNSQKEAYEDLKTVFNTFGGLIE